MASSGVNCGKGPPYYGMQLPAEYIAEGDEKTFQYQDSLPSLPVPDLDHTLAKYLESVRPHLTDEEYKHTERVVQDFGAGIGHDLHVKLLEKSKHKRNWLEKWWEDLAYLSIRSPHSPYINFAGAPAYCKEMLPAKDGSQIERAAIIIWFGLRYWEVLRREKLKVDHSGQKTIWCMHQYKRIFSGCKTPGLHVDKLNDYFKTDSEGPGPTHLVVFCRGRIFTLDVLDSNGFLKTPPEFQVAFQHIRDKCDREAAGPGLGSLTADNRDSWFKLREHLIEIHPDNKRFLQIVERSVFAVALDERSPVTMLEISHEGLLGECVNRWFDKSLTYIIFKNGTVAYNCDHAPFDGLVRLSLGLWEYFSVHLNPDAEWQGPKTARSFPAPTELDFKLDGRICDGIANAQQLFKKAEENLDVFIEYFKGFGKNYIRSFKFHPDAFMQMALQLGYYRIYNKPAPTYETATTRKFYHGRTETVRSCTMESLGWSKAMLDPKVSNQEKHKLLMTAMKKHIDNMNECMENRGCDRHLFGLSITAMEEGIPTPEIFTDQAFNKSGGGGNYIMSTSFAGYNPGCGGAAPMCKDGYGCFYSIQPEQVSFFISTWTADVGTSSEKLYHSIRQSLLDMKEVLESTTQPKL